MYTADIEKEADQQMVDNVLIARFIIMVTAIIFLIITQITIYQSNRTRFWPFFLMQIFFTYNLLYYALLIIEEIFNAQILCPYYGYLKYVFTLIILSSQLILLYYYLMMLNSFYPCNEQQKEYYIYLSQVITNDKIKFIIFLNLFSATTNLVPLLQTNFDITLEQYKNKSQHICNFNIIDSKDFYQYIANWVLIVFLISIVSLILYIKVFCQYYQIRNIVNGKYMNTHEHNFIMGIIKNKKLKMIVDLEVNEHDTKELMKLKRDYFLEDLKKQDRNAFFSKKRYVEVKNNRQGRINIDYYPREPFPDSIVDDQLYIYRLKFWLRLKIDHFREFRMNFKYGSPILDEVDKWLLRQIQLDKNKLNTINQCNQNASSEEVGQRHNGQEVSDFKQLNKKFITFLRKKELRKKHQQRSIQRVQITYVEKDDVVENNNPFKKLRKKRIKKNKAHHSQQQNPRYVEGTKESIVQQNINNDNSLLDDSFHSLVDQSPFSLANQIPYTVANVMNSIKEIPILQEGQKKNRQLEDQRYCCQECNKGQWKLSTYNKHIYDAHGGRTPTKNTHGKKGQQKMNQ